MHEKMMRKYTVSPNPTVYAHIPLNEKQLTFVANCMSIIRTRGKTLSNPDKIHGRPSLEYSDYVITIRSTGDFQSIDVFRNRTGTLLLSTDQGKCTSFSWEYIFVERHASDILMKNP